METNEKDKETEIKNDEEISTQNENEAQDENATLMPELAISEETEEKIRNLAAIIPKFEENVDNKPILESRETVLKADGAIVIGMYDQASGNATYDQNAVLPDQIDIEARKKEEILNKNKKRKNKTPENNKKKKNKFSKSQNITIIVVIFVIIGLVCFGFYFYKEYTTKGTFKTRVVYVELGTKLPIRIADYVELPDGESINEMAYTLDTSKVEIDKVGTYDFTIKRGSISQTGKIIVQDTTPPTLEIRQVIILEGQTYDASQFVAACSDLSGCNYEFKDVNSSSYISAGTYTLFITVRDAYGNETVKQAPLIIEAQGMRLYYQKYTSNNFEENYKLTEEHELHFTEDEVFEDAIILNGIYSKYYEYYNVSSYEKAKQENIGRLYYSFDDEKMIIMVREPESSVGYNYTRMRDINDYLTEEGFSQANYPYIE